MTDTNVRWPKLDLELVTHAKLKTGELVNIVRAEEPRSSGSIFRGQRRGITLEQIQREHVTPRLREQERREKKEPYAHTRGFGQCRGRFVLNARS
jgi:hypothetical protein